MLRLLGLRRFTSQTSSLYQAILTEERTFPKLQRFMTFCDQMERFAQHQAEVREHHMRRDYELRTCTFAAREPVKSALTAYIRYRKDFSSEHIVTSLEWLADVVNARSDHFFTDLSVNELFDDWRFVRILDDIRIGLQPGLFFPPDHIGRALKALASIGFKHAGLMTEMGQKALEKKDKAVNYSPEGTHIFTGFETDPDFQSYVRTLLDWKERTPNPFQHLDKAIQAANQAQNFSKEFAAALLNVSSQYYEMIKAQRENPVFKRDVDIDEGLVELQEVLVRAGLMHPDDFEDLNNFVDMEVKMKRAERVFNDLQKTFPGLNPPIAEVVAKTAPGSEPHSIVFAESGPIPDANQLSARNAGIFAEGLADMMVSATKEQDGSEFPNEHWRKKGSHFLAEKIPEALEKPVLALHLSKTWQRGLGIFSQLLPAVKPLISAGTTQDLCLVLYGMAKGRVIDKELCNLIEFTPAKGSVPLRERVKGLFGAALTGLNSRFADVLLKNFPVEEVADMNRRDAIQLAWALCLLDETSSHVLSKVLEALNDGSVIDKDLTAETSALAYDITNYLQLTRAQDKSTYIPQNFYEHVLVNAANVYDPLKALTLSALRPLLGLNYTEEENKLYTRTMAAKAPRIYPVDDMLAFNQSLAPVFLLCTDGFSLNGKLLLGYARMRQVILEQMGYKPLMVPMHKVVNVNYEKGTFQLNSNFNLKQVVTRRFGNFSDFLVELDETVEGVLEKLQLEESGSRYVPASAFGLVKDLMLLYKLQDALKLKTSPHEIDEKVDEMKLQIVTASLAFERLPPDQQALFTGLPAKLKAVYEKLHAVPVTPPSLPTYLQPWVGLRQGMELPLSGQKSIDPELINQSFLWVANYYQYKDWEERLSRAYPLYVDMTLSASDQQNRLYFAGRRQLYGKTPDPAATKNALDRPIDLEDRVIASLTNLKYELKRTKTDSEILDWILDLDFIGGLISEHLGKNPGQAKPLLPRSPLDFVRMMDHAEAQKMHLDHYTRFYQQIHLKEVARDNLFTSTLQKIDQLMSSPKLNHLEKAAQRNQIIDAYMEEYRRASKDDPDLDIIIGDQKKQKKVIVTNPDSWKMQPKTIFADADYLQVGSDEEFLQLKRLKAEAKLIKASILRRLAQDQPLSVGQNAYLEEWRAELKKSSPNSAGRAYLPKMMTSLSLSDLSPKDSQVLQDLRNVSFPADCPISLNELILELSHFIDDEVINRLEFTLGERTELRKWKGLLPRTDGRPRLRPEWENKELQLRNKELEEQLWLQAGVMTPTDLKTFEDFFGFMKQNTRLGRLWWPYDIGSWREFASVANQRENRLDLMRSWYRRKEQQGASSIPYGPFAKTDFELAADIALARAAQGKAAVEHLADKPWDQLLDSHLRAAANEAVKQVLDSRLDREQNEYLFHALLNHPNLLPRSKEVGNR